MAKVKYDIMEIDRATAIEMVKKYHYSDTIPTTTKVCVGFYLSGELVGMVTLGWGTRPVHTIKKLYSDLDTKDYFEIGRMCMTEEMQRNSESQMLSQLVKWLRVNYPEVKILFTWADGMLGKCGYVYQASNFIYAGHIKSEFYMKDGLKIHPRGIKSLIGKSNDPRITVRPSIEEMKEHGIVHYRGKQFRYLYILDRKYKGQCNVPLDEPFPKESDLAWQIQAGHRKWETCKRPEYITDLRGI